MAELPMKVDWRAPSPQKCIRTVVERTFMHVLQKYATDESREELLADTFFHTQKRLDADPKHTSDAERALWTGLRKRYLRKDNPVSILRDIIRFYVEEIQGHFNPMVFAFSTSILPAGMNLAFHAWPPKRLFSNLVAPGGGIEDTIKITGDVDRVLKLAKTATPIALPTHLSNFDSPVIGWALHHMGFAPFCYGAGLNLFTNPMISFFMNSLGAYKVDRRKKEELYKETLKEYSTFLLELGCPSLFFPGGTRSRSGAIESRLKLGLLGTGLRAYIINLLKGQPKKYFVVPIAMSYHTVLESETLVDDFLKDTGKNRYIITDDEFSKPSAVAQFVANSMGYDSRLYLHVCEPLDLFGNRVDEEGNSVDPNGNWVDTEKYVTEGDGNIREIPQRDAQYTVELGDAVVDAYRRNTPLLSTHVVSFTMFKLLRERHPHLDIYRFLRLEEYETRIEKPVFMQALEGHLNTLRDMASRGLCRLAPMTATSPPEDLLKAGIGHLSAYPVGSRTIYEEDFGLYAKNLSMVYYYSNRVRGHLTGQFEVSPK